MTVDDRQCNECGSSDWDEVEGLEIGYPESRRERDQTIRRVFLCENCGTEGRRFEDGQSSSIQYSGALR